MADTNISGIAKIILQARADSKTANPVKEKEDVDFTSSFMDYMSQSSSYGSMGQRVNEPSGSVLPAASADKTPVYDAYGSKQNSISVKEEMTAEKLSGQGTEEVKKLEEFEENVYQVLEEEYQVSEEEIREVLESLGFCVTDLMNPQNLMTFITELTGEDVGMLFLSENFQNVMQDIQVLTNQLASELGITKEQLMAFCDELKQRVDTPDTEAPSGMEELPGEAGTEEVDAEVKVEVDTEPESRHTAAFSEKQSMSASDGEVKPEEVSDSTKSTKESEKGLLDSAVVTRTNEEDSGETSKNAGDRQFSEQPGSSQREHDTTNTHLTGQFTTKPDEFLVPEEPVVLPYTSQVNVADIIEQITSHIKIHISAEATSMEMQLNPEHLGKVYLHISQQEGAIRAQFAAQNETVKELLETQMVELRQNLNQQGIKVDAIEVTVATHEFEQNLENQARQEEQKGERQEENRQRARRSLNLNDLDGLTGLMSEEEELAARIMRDNGNQVDLTA